MGYVGEIFFLLLELFKNAKLTVRSREEMLRRMQHSTQRQPMWLPLDVLGLRVTSFLTCAMVGGTFRVFPFAHNYL